MGPAPGDWRVMADISYWFNRLVPKDKGTGQIAEGLAYGPDPRHRVDLYAPDRSASDAPLPVMMFFYGGGWQAGQRADYAFAARAFAARGFLVAVPDYRLVPAGAVFPTFVEDCALATAFVARHATRYGGRNDRVSLVGNSAGAYNAVMLGLAPHFLVEAGFEGRLCAVAGISGPYDFYPFDVMESRTAFGHVSDVDSTQPVRLVRPGAPPMLLTTGLKDRTVYPRNTDALAEALRATGNVVETRYYRRLGHLLPIAAVAQPLRWLAPVVRHVSDFIVRQCG